MPGKKFCTNCGESRYTGTWKSAFDACSDRHIMKLSGEKSFTKFDGVINTT